MKQITIRLDEETHKVGRIRAIMKDMSFMKYVVDLIKRDLYSENNGEKPLKP